MQRRAVQSVEFFSSNNLHESLKDGSKRSAIAGERHREIPKEWEQQAWRKNGTEVYSEYAEIAETEEGGDNVAPDSRGPRLMFAANRFTEVLSGLLTKASANDGTFEFNSTDPLDTTGSYMVETIKSTVEDGLAHIAHARLSTGVDRKRLQDLLDHVERWEAIWTRAAEQDPRRITAEEIDEILYPAAHVAARIEEELGAVQGVALASSKDLRLVRSQGIYDAIVRLAERRSNLIYKVGTNHIDDIQVLVPAPDPAVEVMSRDAYLLELRAVNKLPVDETQ